MSKVAVVYWSGTGNTQAMAEQVVAGAKEAGAEVSLFTAAEFDADKMDGFDAVAFGCPSMGAEQLEESEFEPMFSACEAKLNGKKSRCSVPMAGEMASGCATGNRPAGTMALTLPVTSLFVTRPRMMMPMQPVPPWARPLPKNEKAVGNADRFFIFLRLT